MVQGHGFALAQVWFRLHSQTADHHLPYENDEHFDRIQRLFGTVLLLMTRRSHGFVDGQGPWVKDYNAMETVTQQTPVNSPGSGSGPGSNAKYP